MRRADLGAIQPDIEQTLVAAPEQAGQRHAVDGAGIACFRRMAVEMGVDPQQPERFAEHAGDAAPGADGHRVVAADDDREFVGPQRQRHLVSQMPAQFGDPPDYRLTVVIRREQCPAPIDLRVVLQLVPCLRMMEGHRTVLAGLILRPDTAGGADDADTGGFFQAGRFHGWCSRESRPAGVAESVSLAQRQRGEL